MNKKIIFSMLIIGVIGAAGYLVANYAVGSDSSLSSSTANQDGSSSTSGEGADSSGSGDSTGAGGSSPGAGTITEESYAVAEIASSDNFAPALTEGVDFTASLTSRVDDIQTTAVFSFDQGGSYKSTQNYEGILSEEYLVGGVYVTCQNSFCESYIDPNGRSTQTSFIPEDLSYSKSELAAFANKATSIGESDCLSGTCFGWQVKDGLNLTEIYVDSSANTLSRLVRKTVSSELVFDYEYSDVSIVLPEYTEIAI